MLWIQRIQECLINTLEYAQAHDKLTGDVFLCSPGAHNRGVNNCFTLREEVFHNLSSINCPVFLVSSIIELHSGVIELMWRD